MTTPPSNDERRLRTVTTVWAMMLMTTLLYAGFGYLAHGAGTARLPDDVSGTLFLAFAFVAVSTAAGSFIVKRAMLLKATQEQRPDKAQTAYIVAFTLCEAAALFGLVLLFVFDSTYAYLLIALGLVCLLLHKPSREQLAAGPYRQRSWD